MKYEAVFFDIDGTLVSFRTHRMPVSAAEAVARLRERGIRTVIATGRLMRDIRNLDGVTFDGYMTVNGGCCLTAEGEIFHDEGIPREDLALALDHADREPYPVSFMTAEGILVNYVAERVSAIAQLVGLPTPKVCDLRALAARTTVYQANLYVDRERERELMRCFPHCASSRWNELFADVNPLGVDKGRGMMRFLERFGIDPQRTIAFGDGGNDTPMLRAAGLGVAMGDACAEAKAAADWVTTDVDDDGVAEALRRFGVI